MCPIPEYVEERIRKPASEGCGIIPSTTPVVSFGNARTARVATLGLNPSKVEFLDRDGGLLPEGRRRLATLPSLGVSDLATAPVEAVREVLDGCDRYFNRNPYWRWFDRLREPLLGAGAGYRDGTACHLDLVQWATSPTWGGLSAEVKARLVIEDGVFLRRQLSEESVDTLLVNGSGALEGLSSCLGNGDVPWIEEEPLTGHTPSPCRIRSGTLEGRVRMVAWSVNVQSSFGVRTSFGPALRDRISRILGR